MSNPMSLRHANLPLTNANLDITVKVTGGERMFNKAMTVLTGMVYSELDVLLTGLAKSCEAIRIQEGKGHLRTHRNSAGTYYLKLVASDGSVLLKCEPTTWFPVIKQSMLDGAMAAFLLSLTGKYNLNRRPSEMFLRQPLNDADLHVLNTGHHLAVARTHA